MESPTSKVCKGTLWYVRSSDPVNLQDRAEILSGGAILGELFECISQEERLVYKC
jgi:hypothetical protein